MDVPANPFAILTFISAPAVLTNASCVLLFGTGNRYGRATDRVHELEEVIGRTASLEASEVQLRVRQLEAAETRTLPIVRALSFFYAAVAGFVTSTLVSLLGAVLVSTGSTQGVAFFFFLAIVSGTAGVFAMITGAVLLVRETRFSFSILREEKDFLSKRVRARLAAPPSNSKP